MTTVRLVIFAKAPLPGQVKTRLIPALGAAGAARLAERLLFNTIAKALAADIGPVELCVSPAPENAVWQALELPAELFWSDQGEGNLGERMARVVQRVVASGESVLLIGTDCPALDAAQLRDAAHALSTTDAAIAPAADGGYVALGLNRFHPHVFDDIAWSAETVATTTLARLHEIGYRVHVLPVQHDIDRPEDLRWLPATL
ncbi:MAG: TIGR04282 family arsenosugar biosynthesis glycosyltransferase [Xanthomonadales bacterium]|nr:TIGR04282 family arsenosugar biosynthesis glycosyltransferase [Xanthomonadales bacterium]